MEKQQAQNTQNHQQTVVTVYVYVGLRLKKKMLFQ